MAECFINQGAQIIISSHEDNKLKEVAKQLSVDYFLADVTSADNLKKLCQYVFDKYGRIDVWINNAGVQIAPSLTEDVDLDKLKRLFEINFFGYFYGCQIALSFMKKQSTGVIININSTAGLEGKPMISAYSSSKFAIKGLTESIRQEVKDLDIKVYGVFPGGMKTEIYKEKYPTDLNEYMDVKDVADKVIANLNLSEPEVDLVIKRQIKK